MPLKVLPLTTERMSDLDTVFRSRGCSVARDCHCMYYRESGKPKDLKAGDPGDGLNEATGGKPDVTLSFYTTPRDTTTKDNNALSRQSRSHRIQSAAGRSTTNLHAWTARSLRAASVTCNAVKFKAIFTEDAEFYHDRTGASHGDAARTMKSCPRDNGVTRTLVPGSLAVYPMRGYGAIQIGRHTFARAGEPGSEVAQFVHLWKREGASWNLARVLSFDHRPSPQRQQ